MVNNPKKKTDWWVYALLIIFVPLLLCLCFGTKFGTKFGTGNSSKISNPFTSKKPITNLSYSEIRNKQKNLTGIQWDEYEKSIMGKRVQWQGFIDEIKPDITGANIVWIEMDNPPDAISDVFFEYPEEKSLDYSKGQPIEFQGDFDGGIEIIFFVVELKDAEILN